MTSAGRRLDQIRAKHGEVSFDNPLYYEGDLDLALLHSFGPAGLTTANCEPFEKLERELHESHGHNLTPMMLIMPSGFNGFKGETGWVSFIAATKTDKPVFISRITRGEASETSAASEGQPSGGITAKTIALRARAARLDRHILQQEGRYYDGSDPTFFSRLSASLGVGPHGRQVALEVPLYVSNSGNAAEQAEPPASDVPDNEQTFYLNNPTVRVGWSEITRLVIQAYDIDLRSELEYDEHRAYQLAINAYAMLRDIGFSIEEMYLESPGLVRHIEKMHVVKHMLSVLEPNEA